MTLYYTPEEHAEYEAESLKYYFETSMGFLNAHKGLRRGCFHLVMGTTGGGKSTLVRTLIRDILFKKENALYTLGLWLSEETIKQYQSQLSCSVPSADILLSTMAMSEQQIEKVEESHLFDFLKTNRPDIFIFDNITTSEFYMDMPVKAQGSFAKRLKAITQEINCATVLIAHTGAEVTDNIDRLLNINDVRGSKSIANLTEFAYILQRFEVGTNFFPTIRIVKHRSQDLVHNLYLLKYNKEIRAFQNDAAIQFEKFKEMFNARNKLK